MTNQLSTDLNDQIVIEPVEGGILLKGHVFADEADWSAMPMSDQRIVVEPSASRIALGENTGAGLGYLSPHALSDYLCGCVKRRWSGMVCVENSLGVVRLYFNQGRLGFAASNMIDHRLGEVLYRHDKITLEQLAECAVLVTRKNKFGQVLLKRGLLKTYELWDALKLQVIEIVRTVFLDPKVYFEVREGKNLAPTEVVFARGSDVLIRDAQTFGQMFRDFLARLHDGVRFKLRDPKILQHYLEGTFIGDLLRIVQEGGELADILQKSKLMEMNTCLELMRLVNMGHLSIEGIGVTQMPDVVGGATLKSAMDAYTLLLRNCRQAFDAESVEFPLNDLHKFCAELNTPGFEVLYLNQHGEIDKECKLSILSQCKYNENRIEYFSVRFEALMQFLLQLTGDLLSYEWAQKVKTHFRQVRA